MKVGVAVFFMLTRPLDLKSITFTKTCVELLMTETFPISKLFEQPIIGLSFETHTAVAPRYGTVTI